VKRETHLYDIGSVQAINAVGADHAVLGGDQIALGVNKGISGCLSKNRHRQYQRVGLGDKQSIVPESIHVGLRLVGQQLQVLVLHVLAHLMEVERDVAA
jgi:hypothetical protein